ncbi:hypothetical protein [Xanthomonas sp. NCPPB 2632]|uniref:hypothetical protein n=1 Tax=Xanthomonas sp. NCPPB 2632 TaxID=3240912 RepID=UPI0035182B56
MKDARDPGTVEMTLAPKRGRGRPSTGNAKSAAERMREYRARSVTVNRGVLEVALGNASQADALSFQVDGMDQLAEENRQLRALLSADLLVIGRVCDVLAETYAKYQLKIGPFASQLQDSNVSLRHVRDRLASLVS